MQKPNLRQLEVFSVLMETCSVSETAQRLHVTQPAVSKTLATLEEAVELPLFHRVHGRIIPTADAERMHSEVERVFAQMDSLVSSIMGLRSARAGQLKVTTVPAIAATLVGICAGSFQEERSRVRIQLLASMSRDAVEDIANYGAEVAFIHGAPMHPDVRGEIVAESEFVCAMHADHPLAQSTHLTPQELRNQPLIFLDPGSPPSMLVHDKFALAGIEPQIIMETNMSFAARAAALHGKGIALIDSLFTLLDERADLAVRPFRPRIPLQIYAAYSAHRPLSPLAREFIEHVRQHVANEYEQGRSGLLLAHPAP